MKQQKVSQPSLILRIGRDSLGLVLDAFVFQKRLEEAATAIQRKFRKNHPESSFEWPIDNDCDGSDTSEKDLEANEEAEEDDDEEEDEQEKNDFFTQLFVTGFGLTFTSYKLISQLSKYLKGDGVEDVVAEAADITQTTMIGSGGPPLPSPPP